MTIALHFAIFYYLQRTKSLAYPAISFISSIYTSVGQAVSKNKYIWMYVWLYFTLLLLSRPECSGSL